MTELLQVEIQDQGMRLDKFLTAQRPALSRAFVQTLIADGHVHVGETTRKASYAVKQGDRITLDIPRAAPTAARPETIPLDILYEDDALLVVNKPAGMVVHPAAGHASGTLVNAVLGHAPEIVTGNAERPGIVHRLDRDTSGVMLIAKTDAALHALQKQFAARTIHKTYLALVHGAVPTPQGKIDAPLARDARARKKMAVATTPHARQAVTVFHVLAHSEKYSLLSIEPETGRTHQIRVHLAFLKHPVVGDEMYGKRKNELGLERQFLHAWRIQFEHPLSHTPMTFEAALPPDLRAALARAGVDADRILMYKNSDADEKSTNR
ncbi:MAG: RluA family pseudouridine synthase [Chloroflexi bacterium]|nr:RluA family pseudouridine synthase [Chloroflexota bacterium]